MNAKIREIFVSIQGEGPLIGYKQTFVRFCKCNLKCSYCDTDFNSKNANEYSPLELAELCNENKDCHSISLTGGEPLCEISFLEEFLPMCQLPVYLETNGILYDNLEKIIDYIDYISADIKIPSTSNIEPKWEEHDKFFSIAKKKSVFAKVVFDNKITQDEIIKITQLSKKYDIELVLQPVMTNDKPIINSIDMLNILNKCLKYYNKIRLVPQVHKFLNIE